MDFLRVHAGAARLTERLGGTLAAQGALNARASCRFTTGSLVGASRAKKTRATGQINTHPI